MELGSCSPNYAMFSSVVFPIFVAKYKTKCKLFFMGQPLNTFTNYAFVIAMRIDFTNNVWDMGMGMHHLKLCATMG